MRPSSTIISTRFWHILTMISELLELSLCWTLCSLPVITAGASTTALLAVLSDLQADRSGGVVKPFLSVMGQHWKRASLCWLAALAVWGLLLVDLAVCMQNFTAGYGWAVLTGLMAGAALMFCAAQVYLFLLLPRWSGPLRQLAGAAVLLALRQLPSTLVILLAGGFGCWIMGRLWWLSFLFPAFFALPMAAAADRALRRFPLAREDPA